MEDDMEDTKVTIRGGGGEERGDGGWVGHGGMAIKNYYLMINLESFHSFGLLCTSSLRL